jgi:O-antigen ligase
MLAALLGSFTLATSRSIRPALGWLLTAILAVGVLLSNARTIYVALALMLLIMVFVGQSAKLQISRRALRLSITAVLVSACLVWAFTQTKAGAQFVDTTVTELVSGTIDYADDANVSFRFLAWLEAGERFAQNPALGEGFGVPFSFELTPYDVRPHNTFLTILYKMGLLGFLPAMVMLVGFQWKGWNSLRMFHRQRGSVFLYVLLLGELVAYVYGSLNLLLESPFLASIFWLIVGVEMSVMILLRASPDTVATGPA